MRRIKAEKEREKKEKGGRTLSSTWVRRPAREPWQWDEEETF